MSDLTILDRPVVKLIDHMGSDKSIAQAARVSLAGENELGEFKLFTAPEGTPFEKQGEVTKAMADDWHAKQAAKQKGLIKYLLTNRHGSPFEHVLMKFYVKAPIFVFREFHRHRIASYNEMSGRYTTLPSEFYVPSIDRPLVNVGTSARPEFAAGTEEQYDAMVSYVTEVYEVAWEKYTRMLANGIANEVARIVLPVGIYSQMYVTMNLRSIFNFLSLRTDDERATTRSRPQQEIQMVAKEIEKHVAKLYPDAYEAFNDGGRIAP